MQFFFRLTVEWSVSYKYNWLGSRCTSLYRRFDEIHHICRADMVRQIIAIRFIGGHSFAILTNFLRLQGRHALSKIIGSRSESFHPPLPTFNWAEGDSPRLAVDASDGFFRHWPAIGLALDDSLKRPRNLCEGLLRKLELLMDFIATVWDSLDNFRILWELIPSFVPSVPFSRAVTQL